MHFLLEKLKAPSQQFSGRKSRRVPVSSDLDGEEDYKITGSWFKQKVGGILEKEKAAYLDIWQTLNEHIVQVESGINEKERVSIIMFLLVIHIPCSVFLVSVFRSDDT